MRFFALGLVLLTSGCSSTPVGAAGPFRFNSREAVLAGNLTLPEHGKAPFPAVVILHGSGKVTRDQSEYMARRMVDAGFATLTYDKRGVGESTGEYSSVGPKNSDRMFDLLSADGLAGVAVLKARRDIDPKRIGLYGASQAGWIIPLAAIRSRDVAFTMIISGPAVSVGEEIEYSRLAGEDPGSIQGLGDDEIGRRMALFKGPHGYDPLPVLRQLNTPTYWILGGQDRSIPVEKTRLALEDLRKAGRPITLVMLPDYGHNLRHKVNGQPADIWPGQLGWLSSIGILK